MRTDRRNKCPAGKPKLLKNFLCCGSAFMLLGTVAGCKAPTTSAETPIAQENLAEQTAKETASSDRNLVEALLYQWWGLFEAPDRQAVLPFFDHVFAEDVMLRMEDVELDGRETVKEVFASLPQNPHAHQLQSVAVTPLSETLFQLDAEFIYQIQRPDGTVTTGASAYRFEAEKDADGAFRLSKMTSNLGDQIDDQEFKPSYARNRARSTIVQYLGVTDLLMRDYVRLADVVAEGAEVHGMISPEDDTYSDRGDGVLTGHSEIKRWLADRQNRLQWVGHRLTSIDLTPLGQNRYEAATIIDVEAQPIEGDLISVTLPIKITLEDSGDRFMHITRIDR